MNRLLYLLLSLLVVSCNVMDSEEKPNVENIAIDLKVKRLERELFAIKDKESLINFLDKHETLTREFFGVEQYPHDSILVNSLFKLISDPYIDTLYRESQATFGDLSQIKEQFTTAFKHIKYYYPDFEAPEIQTIITGFGRDLFVSDSVIIIGLDYYIGKGASYRPLDIPLYILERYEKEYIVPSCVLLISTSYNRIDPQDHTMLADMIYYGKSYYFADKMLPHTPDSVLLGYTDEEVDDVKAHQQIVWAHFVENKLLYETNHFIKKKYMEERPKTLEIGNKAPGRIGVWLGWEIVKRYMENNPDVSLPQLMETDNGQQIFMQSKYKPNLP